MNNEPGKAKEPEKREPEKREPEKKKISGKKKKPVISNKVWLLLSFLAAMLLWYLLSIGKATSRSFPFADKVLPAV